MDIIISNFIKRFGNKKIVFTGHSLGGGLATLSALDYS